MSSDQRSEWLGTYGHGQCASLAMAVLEHLKLPCVVFFKTDPSDDSAIHVANAIDGGFLDIYGIVTHADLEKRYGCELRAVFDPKGEDTSIQFEVCMGQWADDESDPYGAKRAWKDCGAEIRRNVRGPICEFVRDGKLQPYATGIAIVAARNLSLDPKCTEPVWDRAQADVFLQSINGSLAKMGVSAQIVGSVAIAGRSWKDLDVLLIPNPGTVMTTSMALQAIEDHLMQEISDCKNTNPVDTSWPEEAWFASLYLRDGRLVEFYLPERFFPNVESLADLPSRGDYPRPRM